MTTPNKETAVQATQQIEQPARPSAKALRLLQALDAEITARRAGADATQKGKPSKA